MIRMRWMAAVALAAVCGLTGGAAAGQEGPRAKAEPKAQAAPKAQKVNINEASKSELMKLEGVGASAAERIIAYREAHGPFKRAQDLEKVDKVGRAALEKNPGRIVVK